METPKISRFASQLASDPGSLLKAVQAERFRRSFALFVKEAWQYVPQTEPLVWGWHLEAKCAHLAEVAHGRITQLVINEPPGHAKSVVLAVLWPAWIWTWWPRCQFIFGSYSHNFVVRDARRCRDVIQSPWYRETFSGPAGWALREDYGAADNFSNTFGGVRFATSVGGAGAGLRAHVIGIDDPLNITDAYSDKAREEAILWMSQTLSQRFIAGYPQRIALVMQRLHEDDPTAWLKSRGAEVLRLTSEFEPDERCITYHSVERRNGHVETVREEFWRDPRTEAGELLFPTLYDRNRIDNDKVVLGPFGFAAQHQQRPSPAGGGMFKVDSWRFWTTDRETRERLGLPDYCGLRPRGCDDGSARPVSIDDLEDCLISVDATFHETKDGSFVAIHVWGKLGARRLLLDRVHRRMDFTDTVIALLAVIERWPQARRKLIEGKANGDAIISTLEKSHGISGCEAVSPGKQSKVQRAHAMSPYQAAGNVELPDGALWIADYIAEHAAFPNGAHDDDVDAQSQALQGLERARSTLDLWGSVDLHS